MMQASDFSLTVQKQNLPEVISAIKNFSCHLGCYDRHLNKKIFQKLVDQFTLAVTDNQLIMDDHSWSILNCSFINILEDLLPTKKSKNDESIKPELCKKKNEAFKKTDTGNTIKFNRQILKLVRLVHQIQTVAQRTLNPLPTSLIPLKVVIDNFETFIIPYSCFENYFNKELQEVSKRDFQAFKNERILELKRHSPESNKE